MELAGGKVTQLKSVSFEILKKLGLAWTIFKENFGARSRSRSNKM